MLLERIKKMNLLFRLLSKNGEPDMNLMVQIGELNDSELEEILSETISYLMQ